MKWTRTRERQAECLLYRFANIPAIQCHLKQSHAASVSLYYGACCLWKSCWHWVCAWSSKVLAIAEGFLFVWGFEGRGCGFWFGGFLFVWLVFLRTQIRIHTTLGKVKKYCKALSKEWDLAAAAPWVFGIEERSRWKVIVNGNDFPTL